MQNILHPSHQHLDAGEQHGAPGQWTDLKRDWQRWSRAERIAAECMLAMLVVGGTVVAVAIASLI